MYSAGYEVRRVMYNLTAWNPPPPRRLTVLDRLVKVGGFHSQDPTLISLVDGSGWQRVDLLVISPGTDPAVAERAMAVAGRDGDLHRAGDILDEASHEPARRLSRAGCVDPLLATEWETEGGRVLAS